MKISKKHLLSISFLILLILSGCVVAVPVTEDKIEKADEMLGLGGTLNDLVHDQFDYEMNSEGNTVDKRIEGKYSLRVFTNEEKEAVEVYDEDTAFTYGNSQVGYLTLGKDFEKGSDDLTYQKIQDGSTLEVRIDGYEKGNDSLAEWANFIESGLTDEGFTGITRTETDNLICLSLQPEEGIYWNIYFSEANNRIYSTGMVYVGNQTSVELLFSFILENRAFDRKEKTDSE